MSKKAPAAAPPAIVFRPIDELVPYARNARTHSADQIAQIAASMVEFGFTNPVLGDSDGIVAGHGRVMAARLLYEQGKTLRLPNGGEIPPGAVPWLDCTGWSKTKRRAYILADNQLALNAGWNFEVLAVELDDLRDEGFDLGLLGFDQQQLNDMIGTPNEPPSSGGGDNPGLTDPDQTPEPPRLPASRLGDIWLLDRHRVMCGDSTDPNQVVKLMNSQTAALLHADPPYGMGKESDGVLNDNLYNEKLDAFQMKWWKAIRPHLATNASAYIWGNADDLWRLWYVALERTEKFELRNEIVWDKKIIPGMASPDLTQYPIASERCLFFQFGNQFLGNINADDFPETWDPVRAYMEGEAKAAGIKPGDIKRVCGCGMYSHWFTRSQFTLIPEKHYRALAAEYSGRFARPWSELKTEWDRIKRAGRDGTRSYFDNAHDVMRDVWEFSRVTGDERHGHATPKPVSMVSRALRSSLSPDGLCIEPFSGSGSTIVAGESTGRIVYAMELDQSYTDVTVQRWQDFTGKKATLESDGRTFDEVKAERTSKAK